MKFTDKLKSFRKSVKFKHLNPKRLAGGAWKAEKLKAAAVLKGFEPMIKQAVKLDMKRQYYRHIDKALEGRMTEGDAKHWKRLAKRFKKNAVGEPTMETKELMAWLDEFHHRVRRGDILKQDLNERMPQFREYMESCERDAVENYIIQNKLVEVNK